jgi:hypothetical protein
MARIFVTPAPGLTVPDPDRHDQLPAEGRSVPDGSYWRRRIEDGDVILKPAVEPSVEEA